MATFTINVDGKDIPAKSGQTVLQACRQAGVHIPVLCYEPRLSPLGTCRLCTVEVEGAGLTISCSTMAAEGMVVRTGSESVIAARKARVEQLVADHYGDCLAPCHTACPAGIDVPGYIGLISRGCHQEAVDLIGEAIPLPAVCGRVCPHPCESVCRRSLVEDPVAINNLKRFASQHAGPISPAHPLPPPSGQRVAMVGAGPAGLAAAYFLTLKGHGATMFEAAPLPGGMLRYGIPAYRLPKEVLDREIARILSLGVTLHANHRLGKDFTLKGLFNQGFKAVFLATGASRSADLGVPGEDLRGVISGTHLLFRVASNTPVNLGRRVAVIGGGNTAVDAARTAHRLGAHEVNLLYRRSRSRMPAIPAEVAEAEKEGVKLHFQVAPVRLEGSGGRVERLVCRKTALGRPDASGRPAPELVPGSDFSLSVDSVITATGQQPDLSWLAQEPPELALALRQDQGKMFVVDRDTFATPVSGIFAGGDLVSGPASAIEAMAAGKKAAAAIDRYLRTSLDPVPQASVQPVPQASLPVSPVKKYQFNSVKDGLEPVPQASLPVTPIKKYQFNSVKGQPGEIDKAEYQDVPVSHRRPMPEIPLEARRGNFKEVAAGYSEAEARVEAARCLQCGCSAIEKCTLRSLATEYHIVAPSPRKDRFHFPVDNSNPFVERDDNKCVLCGVCARVCRELLGVGALPATFRVADKSAIVPLTRTGCITCGECIAVCPVGAMSAAQDIGPDREVSTVCPYCSVGCGVVLGVRGGAVVSARGEPSSPVSHGNLCFRGRFGFEFVNHHDRLTHPLIRRHGKLVKASWEDALEMVAEKLALYKGDRFAALASGKLTNEEHYLLQQFTGNVMGSDLPVGPASLPVQASTVMSTWSDQFGPVIPAQAGIHTNTAPCSTWAISALARSACFLVIGTDLSTSFPILWQELRKAVQNGATLLVIDPRETGAARMANLWLRPRPGTDVALIGGMIRVLVEEGQVDTALLENRATGLEGLQSSLQDFNPEKVEELTGVPADRVIEAAYSFIQNRPGMIVCGSGVSRQEHAADLAAALGNLAILAGDNSRIGVPACPGGIGVPACPGGIGVPACPGGIGVPACPGGIGVPACPGGIGVPACPGGIGVPACPAGPGSGLLCLMGQNNARGVYSTTGIPARRTAGIARRTAGIACRGGLSLSPQVKAAYVVGTNPARSAGARAALEELEFLAVQDLFLTETAVLAHVVLPAASFAEKEGTFTNLEGRAQKFPAAIPPPGEARPDWWITSAIARKMAASGFDLAGVAEIAAQMNASTQQVTGAGDQVQHPLELLPLSFPTLPTSGDYPLTLVTGKHLYHFNTGTMTGRIPGMAVLESHPALEIHPQDASTFQIETGTPVRLLSRQSQMVLPGKVTDCCLPGTVYLALSPSGTAETELARFLDAARDGQGNLTNIPVRVERAA